MPGALLTDVFFINDSTGWVIGNKYDVENNGVLLGTTNGGQEWNIIKDEFHEELYSVCFSEISTGWICSENGAIYCTNDSGRTWIKQDSNTQQNLYSISFYNLTNGFCVGGEGIILKTENGGIDWNKNDGLTNLPLWDVYFLDNKHCYIGGGHAENGVLLFQKDGEGWIKNDLMFTIKDLIFLDQNKGWAVGRNDMLASIWRTSDGGQTWINQHLEFDWLQSIYFNDFKNGWVVGDCGILFTNDGGENWDIQTAYSSEDYRSIYGIKNRCFWIVGHRGSILYGDIGNTGVYSKNSSELLHEDIILFQCYPNPFNSKTRIVYQLSKPMNVKIAIYNVNGEIIDLLENQYKSKGQHILNWYSLNLPSAVYYCKIECNNNLKTLKLLLLK